MHDSIRVLVVEHSDTGRHLAHQLLDEFELDFTWQSVNSQSELRDVAREFAPSIVLCVDEKAPDSSRTSLDTLRLLSIHKPVVLISEVNVSNALGVSNEAALRPMSVARLGVHRMVPSAGGSTAGTECVRTHLPSILESNLHVAVMSDSDGWITYASLRACDLLGGSREQLLVSMLGTSEDEVLREPIWAASNAAEDGAADSPGRRAHRLGFIDSWTHLPARVHVNDLVGCLTARARDGNCSLALVGLNLDGLQLLSEAHGHAMGDEVLNQMDAVLRSDVTRCGMAVRVGADDFVIVLPDLSNAPDAAVAVQGILDSVAQRRRLTEIAGPVEKIDDAADLALFAEERIEQPAAPRTEPVDAADALRWDRAGLQTGGGERTAPLGLPGQADLEDAIHRHALSLQYQPQFELSTGRGCGVEVLARWIRSNGESMPPSVFIPLAERGGTIRTLGAWVLDYACQTAATWRGRESEKLTLSVNVSTQQIDEKFQGVLAGILKLSGFPARRLELEISESAIIANTRQTLRCLRQWKDLGVRIAVNHFGTDYSSLSYLSRLKVDRLKLDKSLIHNMSVNKKSADVLDALICLGAELGVDVIAEGVETEPQFHMLAELGCPQVQGYLLARPMHATQAQIALRKTWGNLPASAVRPGAGAAQSYAT